MSLPLPERPRLGSTVHARVHVIDGEEQVILHEWRTGAVMSVSPATYRILTHADGTRDLDALCLAVARDGLYEGQSPLVGMLTLLTEHGFLEDGLPMPSPPSPVAPETTPDDAPIEALPGYGLTCDGSGSCCRFYGGVMFTPLDRAVARVVAAKLRLPVHPDRAFTPVRGAQEDGEMVVAVVDGRCLYLSEENLCEIHRHAGEAEKPFACRFYPTVLVYDGTAVRATPAPECVCVFESAGRPGGAPLVGPDLEVPDLRFAIKRVPDPVPLTLTTSVSRDALRAFGTALAEALEAPTEVDLAGFAFDLADRIEAEGLGEGWRAALAEPRATDVSVRDRWLGALRERASLAAAGERSWRGASDLSRRVAEWVADALAVEDAASAPVTQPDAERFYLRTLAYGHRLALESRPLAHALRDRATRMLTARAMRTSAAAPDDTVRAYPLAMLEAACRNLGIASYADEILEGFRPP